MLLEGSIKSWSSLSATLRSTVVLNDALVVQMFSMDSEKMSLFYFYTITKWPKVGWIRPHNLKKHRSCPRFWFSSKLKNYFCVFFIWLTQWHFILCGAQSKTLLLVYSSLCNDSLKACLCFKKTIFVFLIVSTWLFILCHSVLPSDALVTGTECTPFCNPETTGVFHQLSMNNGKQKSSHFLLKIIFESKKLDFLQNIKIWFCFHKQNIVHHPGCHSCTSHGC